MRSFRIFLTCTQEVIAERSEQVIWLLLSCINPLLMILFWRGSSSIKGWTGNVVFSYYLLIIVAGAFLMPHTEENVGVRDIQEGQLSMYILKPFSYYWLKFFNAAAYRIISGIFSILIFIVFLCFSPNLLNFSNSPVNIFLSIIISLNALFLSFSYKMIIGISAFWLIEIRGLFEVVEVVLAVFAGYLMPIALFPDWLAGISYALPFSYMIYFPVISFEGRLSVFELYRVIIIQIIWLYLFYLLYKKMWNEGLKKYSAVGQ